MAKPNYSFEKRQRELAKKEKKAKKEREKSDRKSSGSGGEGGDGAEPATTDEAAGSSSDAQPAMGPTGG